MRKKVAAILIAFVVLLSSNIELHAMAYYNDTIETGCGTVRGRLTKTITTLVFYDTNTGREAFRVAPGDWSIDKISCRYRGSDDSYVVRNVPAGDYILAGVDTKNGVEAMEYFNHEPTKRNAEVLHVTTASVQYGVDFGGSTSASVQVSPDIMFFDEQEIGTSSIVGEIVLHTGSANPLKVLSAELTGTDCHDYKLVYIPKQVAGGDAKAKLETGNVRIAFAPVTIGDKYAQLSIRLEGVQTPIVMDLVGKAITNKRYKIYLNNTMITLKETPMLISHGVFVSADDFLNYLGYTRKMETDSGSHIFIQKKTGKLVIAKPESRVVMANGAYFKMNSKSFVKNGQTFVEMVSLARHLGYKVDANEYLKSYYIQK